MASHISVGRSAPCPGRRRRLRRTRSPAAPARSSRGRCPQPRARRARRPRATGSSGWSASTMPPSAPRWRNRPCTEARERVRNRDDGHTGRPQTHRRPTMANLVVHFEIHASEPRKLIDFYTNLLGWTFTDYGGGDQPYWVIDTGEGAIDNVAGQPGQGINGGLTQRMGPAPAVGGPVTGANLVVAVEDVDGLMRRGIELGATEAL